MATQEIKAGLATDPSKVNQYGANQADLQEYQDSLAAQIKSLEDRYSNPNWFKVAAGFLKPQLGGFAASLGSASDALGENVEAGRAAALPIAQMRSQLAQSKIMTGQNKDAADLVRAHEAEGAPLHKLPDLVAKLKQLGSPLATGPEARLDQARKTQQTAIERANLIRSSNEQQRSNINSALANKEITIADAEKMRKALPAIPEVPDLFAVPATSEGMTSAPPAKAVAGNASAAPSALDAAATASAPTAPVEVATKDDRELIRASHDLSDEKGRTQAQIDVRTKRAAANAETGDQVYGTLRSIAGPESYNDNVTPIENSLKLLGYGEQDPVKKAAIEAKAKKVMNVLAGSEFDAFLKSINTGVTGKVGDIYAQISLPIEEYVRARVPPEMQDYAIDLAQNFAQASIVRQRLGGVSPNAATNSELHLYGTASPSMNSSPIAAMKNLLHLHTSFDQLQKMHDFLDQVHNGDHPKYKFDPNSETRAWDIIRSKPYKQIADDFLKKHRSIEDAASQRK